MAKAEYSNFTLTNAQTNALKAFRQFMQDRKNRIFVLRGYAGTGKTTLMRFFIDELKKAGAGEGSVVRIGEMEFDYIE